MSGDQKAQINRAYLLLENPNRLSACLPSAGLIASKYVT